MSECTRRRLLGGAVAACLVGCGRTGSSGVDTADLPEVGTEGWWWAPFADYPALGVVGGSAEVHVLEALLHVIVVREAEDEAVSVWSICSHGACEVEWEGASRELVCPCHGSRFGLDGKVHDGPAPAPLDVFPTVVADGGVWIWRPA